MEGNGSGKRYFKDEDYTLVFDNEIANAPITASPGDIIKVMISDITKFPKKPWNDQGADLSDYFNYNFDENTWSQYSKLLRDHIENYGACGDALYAPLQGYNEGIPNVFGFSPERTLSDIDAGTFEEKPWLTPRADSSDSSYGDYSSTSSNPRKKREHESLENGNMVLERSHK